MGGLELELSGTGARRRDADPRRMFIPKSAGVKVRRSIGE